MRAFLRSKRFLTLIALVIISAGTLPMLPRQQAVLAASDNWPTYMGNNERTSFNGAETTINPTSALHLKLHWKLKAAGRVAPHAHRSGRRFARACIAGRSQAIAALKDNHRRWSADR